MNTVWVIIALFCTPDGTRCVRQETGAQWFNARECHSALEAGKTRNSNATFFYCAERSKK